MLHVVCFLSRLLLLETTLSLFVVENHEADLRELHTSLYRLFEVILHRGQIVATCYVEEPVLFRMLWHKIVRVVIEEEIPEVGLPRVIEVLFFEAGHYAQFVLLNLLAASVAIPECHLVGFLVLLHHFEVTCSLTIHILEILGQE